jgi:hypothetical protein
VNAENLIDLKNSFSVGSTWIPNRVILARPRRCRHQMPRSADWSKWGGTGGFEMTASDALVEDAQCEIGPRGGAWLSTWCSLRLRAALDGGRRADRGGGRC